MASEPAQPAKHESIEEALRLQDHIADLADANRYLEILAIRDDPATPHLIELLPTTQRERAELHFRLATRWEERQGEIAERRLAEAEAALARLDLGMARALLGRVESRWLSPSNRDHKDQLLLDISARRIELEELNRATSDVRTHRDLREGPWWKRFRRH